jgi:HMG (high mobility group) box
MMHHCQVQVDEMQFHENILSDSKQFHKSTNTTHVLTKPISNTVGRSPSTSLHDNAYSNMTRNFENSSIDKQQSSSMLTQRLFPGLIVSALESDSILSTSKMTEIVSQNKTNDNEKDTAEEMVQVQPLRPLSAYNYFFRDERERILRQSHDFDPNITSENYPYTEKQQQVLLHEYWSQDRTQKRRHRKTHGKITFTALSKLVSKRWKQLQPEQKEFYQHVACKDWKRYQEDLTRCKMHA